MAMNSGEQGIVSALQSAVSLFRSNLSTFVPDIYAYETTAAQNEITTWWQNPNNLITIQVGYSKGPVKGMSWNVTIGPDQEVPARQMVGSSASMSAGVVTQASTFESPYIIGILDIGQDKLRWSQMLCKWALLYYRQSLEQQYGLEHQRISMGPLQPVPDDLRDAVQFQFMRTITLTAQHVDTWSQLAVPTITEAKLTLNPI